MGFSLKNLRHQAFQQWCAATLSFMSIVVLGTCLMYGFFTLPYVEFNNANPAYWIKHTSVFAGYALLALTVGICIRLVELFGENSSYNTIWWKAFFGGISISLSTLIVLHFIIMPAFYSLNGLEWEYAYRMWFINSSICLVLYLSYLIHQAVKTQREQSLHAELETAALATALDRTELSMLEAQIEPHFLFNTLAHIKRQYRHDTDTAEQMLSALINYLDQAIPALRRKDWTVGDEFGLIKVYLEILAQRFGDRLQFSVAALDACKNLHLPALTIATLVENSVRHGLSPKSGGGTISVSAQIDDAGLHIEVCDNGVGLRLTSGTGLGLLTVRARLKNAYNNSATFIIEPGAIAGVRASIQVPLNALQE